MAKKTQRYDNESISSLKGADRVRNALRLFLVLMVSKAVSIQFLKFLPTVSTKQGKVMVKKSHLPVLQMEVLK